LKKGLFFKFSKATLVVEKGQTAHSVQVENIVQKDFSDSQARRNKS